MKENDHLDWIASVDTKNELYPCCIVWTSIPVVTWLLPFVGHVGICDSSGTIYDFAGPFLVNEGCMAFGNPEKYWCIKHLLLERESPQKTRQDYDLGVATTTNYFRQTQWYNFFTNNCHSFVASCLLAAQVGATQRKAWNMVTIAFYMTCCARYVSFGRALKAHLPFLIILTFILLFAFLR